MLEGLITLITMDRAFTRVTEHGIDLLSCVFQCCSKGPQSYKMYKNPLLGFLMLFCHVFIDAPKKLPIFGAFSTLGTALLSTLICPILAILLSHFLIKINPECYKICFTACQTTPVTKKKCKKKTTTLTVGGGGFQGRHEHAHHPSNKDLE